MKQEKKMSQLYAPSGIFVSNGEVFFCDEFNHRVRKVLRNGQIVTIAGISEKYGHLQDGQPATNTRLYYPHSVFVSSSNQVYISEKHRIRKIDQNGIMWTIAGCDLYGFGGDGGLAIHSRLFEPRGLFVTEEEEVLFADFGNCRIRRIDRCGMISTIAGDGGREFNGDEILATNASVYYPTSVVKYKEEIYLTDTLNHLVRKINKDGMITSILGTVGVKGSCEDGTFAKDATINYVTCIFIHQDEIYFSETGNHCIRKIFPNGMIKTIAGCGEKGHGGNMAIGAALNSPKGLFVDSDSQVYFSDCDNHCIRKVDKDGCIVTLAGTPQVRGYSGDVPFDFNTCPHIGRLPLLIRPFPQAYHDLIFSWKFR